MLREVKNHCFHLSWVERHTDAPSLWVDNPRGLEQVIPLLRHMHIETWVEITEDNFLNRWFGLLTLTVIELPELTGELAPLVSSSLL